MTKKIYEAMMQAAGWTRLSDKGEAYFIIDLDDRVLRCFPTFSKLPKSFVLRDEGQVWYEPFARLRSFIVAGNPDFSPLLRRKNSEFRTEGDATAEFIAASTDSLKDWARGVDPDAEIQRMAAIKPRYMLTAPDHLAALAKRGDVARLETFRAEMAETGKVSILHPMIKAETIDRALRVAQEVKGGADGYHVAAELISA